MSSGFGFIFPLVTLFLNVDKPFIILLQCKISINTTLADFKSLPTSFPQSHPPLSSFFLSVNMSGEEHKKGRVSELEGQQRASGRAMFLLSGPQREGAKEGSRERGSMRRGEGEKGGMEQAFFFFSSGNHEGRALRPSRPGLFYLYCFY